MSPNWFLNMASPVVNVPLKLFFPSVFIGKFSCQLIMFILLLTYYYCTVNPCWQNGTVITVMECLTFNSFLAKSYLLLYCLTPNDFTHHGGTSWLERAICILNLCIYVDVDSMYTHDWYILYITFVRDVRCNIVLGIINLCYLPYLISVKHLISSSVCK